MFLKLLLSVCLLGFIVLDVRAQKSEKSIPDDSKAKAEASAKQRLQFLILLRLSPALYDEKNWTERENKLVGEHFAQLQKLLKEGKLILAGRTDVRESMGMIILEVESEAEARAIMENDAAVKGKVMTAELFPYKVALKK
jgi:uncharacterized protein